MTIGKQISKIEFDQCENIHRTIAALLTVKAV